MLPSVFLVAFALLNHFPDQQWGCKIEKPGLQVLEWSSNRQKKKRRQMDKRPRNSSTPLFSSNLFPIFRHLQIETDFVIRVIICVIFLPTNYTLCLINIIQPGFTRCLGSLWYFLDCLHFVCQLMCNCWVRRRSSLMLLRRCLLSERWEPWETDSGYKCQPLLSLSHSHTWSNKPPTKDTEATQEFMNETTARFVAVHRNWSVVS